MEGRWIDAAGLGLLRPHVPGLARRLDPLSGVGGDKAVQGKGILASGSSCGFQVGVEQQVKGLFAFGQKVIVTGAAPACALQ